MNIFMKEALVEAYKAYRKDEVPVGCIIEKNGKIIARAHNLVETLQNATAHAEILAIQQANKTLGVWRLEDCNIYVTLEPCSMCLGAIINARIKTVHVGARDKERGTVLSKIPIIKDNLIPCKTNAIIYDYEICSYIMTRFFRKLRKNNKKENKIL